MPTVVICLILYTIIIAIISFFFGKKIGEKSRENAFLLFYGIGIITVFFIIVALRSFYEIQTKDVVVEVHGLLFDLIVLGFILTVYELIRNSQERKFAEAKAKQEKIERYQEELEDLRALKDQVTAFRIAGLIKRLNTFGIHDFNLQFYNLDPAWMHGVDLRKSKLWMTDFSNAHMEGSKFNSASFFCTKFENTKLLGAQFNNSTVSGDFTNADLSCANFFDSVLNGCNFTDANLFNANLQHAKLKGAALDAKSFHKADLLYADLEGALTLNANWIDDLKKQKVNGIHLIETLYFVNTKKRHSHGRSPARFVIERK